MKILQANIPISVGFFYKALVGSCKGDGISRYLLQVWNNSLKHILHVCTRHSAMILAWCEDHNYRIQQWSYIQTPHHLILRGN